MTNKDPNFKIHMVCSLVGLIGGSIFILIMVNPDDCDLEFNPLCPEQIIDLQIKGLFIWWIISIILVVLRIIAHNVKTQGKSQNNTSVEGNQ